MEEENQTIEDVKRENIMERIQMPKLNINGKIEYPNLIICVEKKQIKIFMNQRKVYRTINLKNKIENVLDIFLVDTIKELLQKLSDSEQAADELNEQEDKNESTIRKSERTTNDDRTSGQSRTDTGKRFV